MSVSASPPATGTSASVPPPILKPEKTKFQDIVGRVAFFFFRNNPWRVSERCSSQKIYRYCIACGEDRFSDIEWRKSPIPYYTTIGHNYATICGSKTACREALLFSELIPRQLLEVQKSDQARLKTESAQGIMEAIPDICVRTVDDRIYKKEDEIPPEFRAAIKKYEQIPVSNRINVISCDTVQYCSSNKIDSLNENHKESSDPFLKAMNCYRQRCVELSENLIALEKANTKK